MNGIAVFEESLLNYLGNELTGAQIREDSYGDL